MNTLGAWTHKTLYDNKMPYVEVLAFYAGWKSESCPSCYIPDVYPFLSLFFYCLFFFHLVFVSFFKCCLICERYDPGFAISVRANIREKVLPKVNDPYYMG